MVTDISLILLFIFLLIQGAVRGVWFSLITPLSMGLAGFFAYTYFQISHKLFPALAVAIIGQLVLYYLFKFLLYALFDQENQKYTPTILSRLLGSIITFIWGLLFIFPVLYISTFIPPLNSTVKDITRDIKSSVILETVVKETERIFPKLIIRETPSKTNSSQDFRNDPRLKEIYEDETIKKQIETKNISALMSNPKILALAQDPEFVKKMLLELQKQQSNPALTDQPAHN